MTSDFGEQPSGPAPTNAGLAGASARRRGGLAHWRRDVALPFALGLLCLGGWAGAFALGMATSSPSFSLTWVALRAAQTLLLAPPVLILIVGVARAHAFWRETGRGLWGAPVRVAVGIVMIALSLAPIFFAVAPQPAPAYNGQTVFLAMTTPECGLGLALGFAWGAHIRPVFSGMLVGLMGSLGVAAPLVVVGISGLAQTQHAPSQCHGSLGGCEIGGALATVFVSLLIVSPLLIGFVTIIGSAFGAFLSGE